MSQGKASVSETAVQGDRPLSGISYFGIPDTGSNRVHDDQENVSMRKSGVCGGEIGICGYGLLEV